MPIKLLSESMDASITDDDVSRIDKILSFWFKEQALSAPQIDRRMDIWFGENPDFDDQIEAEFSDDIARASKGKLDHWADDPRGRLALIILIDQFRRNIYRNTKNAFSKDNLALKLCVEGAMEKKDRGLTPIQKVFFYMPLQHAEDVMLRRMSRRVNAEQAEQQIIRMRELIPDLVLRTTFITGFPGETHDDHAAFLDGDLAPDGDAAAL